MQRALLLVVAASCRYSEPAVGPDAAAPPPDGPPDTLLINCPTAYTIVGATARYRFTSTSGDYPTVDADCKSDGGHLVKIENLTEDSAITAAFMTQGLTSSDFVWIGLSDQTGNNMYQWSDSSPLGSYNGFPNGQIPADTTGNQNCVDKRGSGPWDIYFCTHAELGFCECN